MIWGSQYDAILNFALIGKDKSKVTETTNAIHGTDNATNTGITKSDRINNIYDLGGNLREWTLEAVSTNIRVGRGGTYANAVYSPASRGAVYPSRESEAYSTRFVIYCK